MSPHYLVKCTTFRLFHFYAYWVPIRDMDELRNRIVATWGEFQHSLVDDAVDQWQKDWKHVPVQKVVTLNTCCNVACLAFYLPHITTGFFFRPTNANPQPAFLRATNVWRNAEYLQSDEKVEPPIGWYQRLLHHMVVQNSHGWDSIIRHRLDCTVAGNGYKCGI